MKQITPIQLWNNGEMITATNLSLTLVHDNLQDTAVFSYRLCKYIGEGEDVTIQDVATGSVSIEGEQYANWGTTMPANEEAYIIAADKLNLTLVNN